VLKPRLNRIASADRIDCFWNWRNRRAVASSINDRGDLPVDGDARHSLAKLRRLGNSPMRQLPIPKHKRRAGIYPDTTLGEAKRQTYRSIQTRR
jgi:hypothetical protein